MLYRIALSRLREGVRLWEKPKSVDCKGSHATANSYLVNRLTLENSVSSRSAVAVIDKTGKLTKCWGKIDVVWAFAFGVVVLMVPAIGPLLIAASLLAGPLAGWIMAGAGTRRGGG